MGFMEQFNDLIHRRTVLVVSNLHELGFCLHTNVHLYSFHLHGYIKVLNLWSLNLAVAFCLRNVNLQQILILFFGSYIITFQRTTQLSSPFRLHQV